MKKTVSIILALIISASAATLAGCGSKKQAEQPTLAAQSGANESSQLVPQGHSDAAEEETTQQGTTEMNDEAALYKPLAQKLLDYVGKAVDMSLYSTEDQPVVGFYQFYFEPKSEIEPVMNPIVPEIELPGVVTIKLGMQYKELQALGFQNSEWDDRMVEAGYSDFYYSSIKDKQGSHIGHGLFNRTGADAKHSECTIDTFSVFPSTTGKLYNYHGITESSTIEDIVKILGMPSLQSNVLVSSEYRGEIKLVYNNHDDKSTKTSFVFEYEFSTDKVEFKELKVENYRP